LTGRKRSVTFGRLIERRRQMTMRRRLASRAAVPALPFELAAPAFAQGTNDDRLQKIDNALASLE